LFAVDESVSREASVYAEEAGTIVIDNSAAFRLEEHIPLVVPEINGDLVSGSNLIANPNCSTIQLVILLNPVLKTAGLGRVIVSTYQSVSGSGLQAQQELLDQLEHPRGGADPSPEVYPCPIAFNCFPQVGEFDAAGFCTEEQKIVLEARKILREPALSLSATTVRIPTMRSHAQAIYIETRRDTDVDELRDLLSNSPGVKLLDRPELGVYPTPLQATGSDFVWVGRIRKAFPGSSQCFWLWGVSDNLRKGAALNAVQIMKIALSIGNRR
jgi:aspartate-semialdehyde dehydrogenase